MFNMFQAFIEKVNGSIKVQWYKSHPLQFHTRHLYLDMSSVDHWIALTSVQPNSRSIVPLNDLKGQSITTGIMK